MLNIKRLAAALCAAVTACPLFIFSYAAEADPDDQKEAAATETEFVAPDTYPSIYATPYAKETDSGIAYLISDDGKSVSIAGYRGDSTDMIIPDTIDGLPVTAVEPSAFVNSRITSAVIADSVKSIGEEAFAECAELHSVVLPSGLTVIEAKTFENCVRLEKIELPQTLCSIGDSTFEGCRALGKVTVPAAVAELGTDVFLSCDSLTHDCADNNYAADYAAINSIPTSFTDSWNYTLLLCVIITVVFGAAVFTVYKIYRTHFTKKKNSKG